VSAAAAETLHAEELAARLGVSTWTVYESVRRGDCPIRPIRIGKRLVWPKAQEAYSTSMNAVPGSEEYPRLPPLETTIKTLFALSGNLCSFPGCQSPVINEMGDVVAQIVHNRGVKPGSPRFDATQSPEDRRDISNLTIMCYPHHQETNDEARFPVERMREIKELHEARYRRLVVGLQASLEDQTERTLVRPPTTMSLYQRHCDLQADEVEEARARFSRLLEELKRLPPDGRSILAVIISRGKYVGENSYEITMHELGEVLNISRRDLGDRIGTLQYRDYVYLDVDGRDGYPDSVAFVSTVGAFPGTDRYPLIDDLKLFAELTGVGLRRMLVELDLSALDG